MAESDWGLGDVRSRDPALGTSPSGASEGLYGVLKTFLRSPEFVSMLRSQSFIPQSPGDIKPTAAAQAPAGWLLCDGSTYQIQAYPKLWAAIGAAYGGDGVVGFKVPDLRGRVPVGTGFGGVGLSNRVRGDIGGAEGVVIATANLPAHAHAITDQQHAHVGSNGQNLLTSDGSAGVVVKGTPGAGQTAGFFNATAAVATDLRLTGITTTQNAGGGTATATMPPFTALNFVIFTGV